MPCAYDYKCETIVKETRLKYMDVWLQAKFSSLTRTKYELDSFSFLLVEVEPAKTTPSRFPFFGTCFP